ncbi:glycosyltransferase family 2 protein [Parafrigoribacterium soli]|uniref:glycosyltransferase family 2 protein n=1 Tax=Parafrigoribacterium soli TaxID=3144663 RepID=UPI0032EEB2D9
MQQRVTAIIVARTGAASLERTLAALAKQTRQPDTVIAVDAASNDGSAELFAAYGPTQFVTTGAKTTFGEAISRALHVAAEAASENDLLWLLGYDNAPAPDALAQLLATLEVAPSVAIAGPKLMRADQPDFIASFGESMTRFGASVQLVDGELDQAQHDARNDVLGVAAAGMLVRRSVWTALGGFDPGLPSIDAGLDFSVRARLAGHRVALVPGARVASAGGPQLFGRRSVSERRRMRTARAAQLHRRLVYARGWTLPLHWLSLLPLAVLRAIGQLLAKRPGAVGGEFSAALAVAFGATHVGAARRQLRRTRALGWGAIAPLRLPGREVRERRAQAREVATGSQGRAAEREARVGFISGGGLWIVIVAGILGVAAYGTLLGNVAVTGGGLLPLSTEPGELWRNVGYGWRDIGLGFMGPSDPFAYVLAVLGSLTFWAPSFSIVLVYVLALPIAAIGAWFCARRLTQRRWLPAIAALLWMLAPPLLGSLATGHLGAILAHLLVPWLVLCAINATRSWAAAAGAALLFAAITASAPSLAPALVIAWVAWLFAQPKSAHRLIGIPIPAASLFLPLVLQQFNRGNPFGLFADPGVPTAVGPVSGWHLALAAPAPGLDGWQGVFDAMGFSGAGAPLLVAVLLAPLGVLAILALFVPGSRRSIPSMLVALLGYLSAVAAVHIVITRVGAEATPVWAGAALSLYWLGLLGAVMVALDALRAIAPPFAILVSLTVGALAVPLLSAAYLGISQLRSSGERLLPAFVAVEAAAHPSIGTLLISPHADDGITVDVQRGSGTTLDDQSTLHATATTTSKSDARLARLAGNLASRSGYNASADLRDLGIGFVLLSRANGDDAVRERISQALDGNDLLVPVGTTDSGSLWRTTAPTSAAVVHPSNTDTPYGAGILLGQGLIFTVTLLLGIPTGRRRRKQRAGDPLSEPATTFDEENDD